MGVEIERKFLVEGDAWRLGAHGTPYRQGYLSTEPGRVVRVRVAGERGYLTVKGPAAGAARPEFEFEIPARDAEAMLDALCLRPLVEKTRYRIAFRGHAWEVDEFHAENAGLILAEVELGAPDEPVELPPWVGEEVTADPRYSNAALTLNPYQRWATKS